MACPNKCLLLTSSLGSDDSPSFSRDIKFRYNSLTVGTQQLERQAPRMWTEERLRSEVGDRRLTMV